MTTTHSFTFEVVAEGYYLHANYFSVLLGPCAVKRPFLFWEAKLEKLSRIRMFLLLGACGINRA